MNLSKLNTILADEPRFRIKQARQAVWLDLIEDWGGATSLPAELREKLKQACPLEILAEVFRSKDKATEKAAITLVDGKKIETVLMRHKDGRLTVCVSTQVGCPLGCLFCATGKMGFVRNLTAEEISEQVLFWNRQLKKAGEKERVSNVVFMGMGEPALNYENVISAIKEMNDKDGLNLGARKFSISTVGITEGIERLAKEKLQINLAISLHAADDKLRTELMPINKKYSIRKIMAAVDDYIKKTRRKVMFEYLLLDGINDSEQNARALAKLMKKPLYHVNLITYNSTGAFRPSGRQAVERFKKILERERVSVSQRYSFGQDIKAACGQLCNM